MTPSSWEEFLRITSFSRDLARIFATIQEQPELSQSVLTEEWLRDVHEDTVAFYVRLPPPLQALRRAVAHLEAKKRGVSWMRRAESNLVEECDWKIRRLEMFYDILLLQEIENYLYTTRPIKGKTFYRYLGENWTVHFVEKIS